jgi:hypothetical protein
MSIILHKNFLATSVMILVREAPTHDLLGLGGCFFQFHDVADVAIIHKMI